MGIHIVTQYHFNNKGNTIATHEKNFHKITLKTKIEYKNEITLKNSACGYIFK